MAVSYTFPEYVAWRYARAKRNADGSVDAKRHQEWILDADGNLLDDDAMRARVPLVADDFDMAVTMVDDYAPDAPANVSNQAVEYLVNAVESMRGMDFKKRSRHIAADIFVSSGAAPLLSRYKSRGLGIISNE